MTNNTNLLKGLVRDIVTDTLWWLGITKPKRNAQNKLTVVTFHRVLPQPLRAQYPYPGICVTPEELDWFCKYFQHYDTVGPLTETLEAWQANTDKSKSFLAITFDDAQWDNFHYALPILNEYGYKATFYIPTESVDNKTLLWHDRLGYIVHHVLKNQPNQCSIVLDIFKAYHYQPHYHNDLINDLVEFAKTLTTAERNSLIAKLEEAIPVKIPEWGKLMSWQEIRYLNDQGHEIGAHSVTHEILTSCNQQTLNHEIFLSKQRIEAELSKNVHSFCYPNGNHNADVVSTVIDAEYKNATTTIWGINKANVSLYTLKRIDINAFNNLDRKSRLSVPRFAYRLTKKS